MARINKNSRVAARSGREGAQPREAEPSTPTNKDRRTSHPGCMVTMMSSAPQGIEMEESFERKDYPATNYSTSNQEDDNKEDMVSLSKQDYSILMKTRERFKTLAEV
jgi:hypothetical protein